MLVSSSLSTLRLSLIAVLDYGSIACLGLRARALSDLEARMAIEQRAQEVTTELVALTISE